MSDINFTHCVVIGKKDDVRVVYNLFKKFSAIDRAYPLPLTTYVSYKAEDIILCLYAFSLQESGICLLTFINKENHYEKDLYAAACLHLRSVPGRLRKSCF